MDDNIKYLVVAFNDSTGGALKARRSNFLKNLKLNKDFVALKLEYFLNCGDISNVPFSNPDGYELYYTEPQDVYNEIQKTIAKINSYNKKTPIELFVNPKRANELCNLYFFAKIFANKENVSINYYHKENIEIKLKKLGTFLDTEIVIDKRIPLTNDLIATFNQNWQRLVSNNSFVREFVGNDIKEYTMQEAKDKILPFFSENFVRFPKLYNKLIETYDSENPVDFTFVTFECVTKKLIEGGIIERTSKTSTVSGCDDIYFEQDFRLKK